MEEMLYTIFRTNVNVMREIFRGKEKITRDEMCVEKMEHNEILLQIKIM